MIPVLVFAVLILVAVCATLYIMLLAASRDIDQLEDFIVELDEGLANPVNTRVMAAELRSELAQEADDIRDSRKEEGDE